MASVFNWSTNDEIEGIHPIGVDFFFLLVIIQTKGGIGLFDYSIVTDKTVDDAINSLEAKLKEEQFGVLWMFDIQKKLHEKGLEFNKSFRVLEVCNPVEAQRVLNENEMAGYFLPCKIVVFESEGRTKIGMPRPTALISILQDEKLKLFAKDIEERLIRCISGSV